MSDEEKKPLTKSEVTAALCESTGLTKQQVNGFFDALTDLVAKNLAVGGPGILNVASILKFKVVRKEAVPERMGKHPFTGVEQMLKAKPAQNLVKVTALKKLKDAVK